MTKAFHIAFGVDNNYARPMGVTITSILENNPNMNFVFHAFTHDISSENIERLEALEKKYQTKIQIHQVDPSIFQEFGDFPKFRHYSIATFYRLLIPSRLQDVADRVLYLDADILCFGNLEYLANLDFENYCAAAVHDSEKTERKQIANLGLKHGRYFNAGFLYINIAKWNENNISHEVMASLFDKNIELEFYDQDALNKALDGKVLYIETKWNYQYRLTTQLKSGKTKFDIPGDSVFIHFVGAMKPWRDWSPHESKNIFDRYQASSSWENKPFGGAMHYKEMHSLGAFCFKKGDVFDGIKWYMSYLKKKCLPYFTR